MMALGKDELFLGLTILGPIRTSCAMTYAALWEEEYYSKSLFAIKQRDSRAKEVPRVLEALFLKHTCLRLFKGTVPWALHVTCGHQSGLSILSGWRLIEFVTCRKEKEGIKLLQTQ